MLSYVRVLSPPLASHSHGVSTFCDANTLSTQSKKKKKSHFIFWIGPGRQPSPNTSHFCGECCSRPSHAALCFRNRRIAAADRWCSQSACSAGLRRVHVSPPAATTNIASHLNHLLPTFSGRHKAAISFVLGTEERTREVAISAARVR